MNDVRPKCGSRRTSQHLEVIFYETAAFCIQSDLRQGGYHRKCDHHRGRLYQSGLAGHHLSHPGLRGRHPGHPGAGCGGDGTLSETAAGLLALPQPPLLGYIPSGSTNDCAATLRIPQGYKPAAELAAGDTPPLKWDIGTLNDRPFVYVAAFGAFTEVAYDTPQELKNTFGHLAYIMAGIASLPSITPYHLKLEYDGQTIEDDFFYGMVCNTYSVGGIKNLPTDRVDLNDGLFEVILVRKPMNIFDIGAGLQALLRPGAAEESGALLSFHAARLRFLSEKPIPWTIDGEYGGSHEVNEVRNHRQALSIIAGPDASR